MPTNTPTKPVTKRATKPVAKPTNRAALYSSATDDWPTPPAFVAALHAEFGFVLDVCASTTNHKAPAYYALDHPDPARRDGLAADWAADAARLGGAAWMNSPYGRPIGAWMAKAAAAARAGAVVVALVPVRADTAWWHEHVLGTGAEVRYVRGRLTFGDAKNTAAFASAVVIYRPTDVPGTNGPVTTMPAHPTPTASAAPAAPAAPAAAAAATPAAARTPLQPRLARRVQPLAPRPGKRTGRRAATQPGLGLFAATHPHGSAANGPTFAGQSVRTTRTGRQIDSPTRQSHNHKAVEHLFDSHSPRVSPATTFPHGATHV